MHSTCNWAGRQILNSFKSMQEPLILTRSSLGSFPGGKRQMGILLLGASAHARLHVPHHARLPIGQPDFVSVTWPCGAPCLFAGYHEFDQSFVNCALTALRLLELSKAQYQGWDWGKCMHEAPALCALAQSG